MLVYQYDANTGEYLSTFDADESPLEPGVYLIPAYCTDVAIPDYEQNKRPVFADGGWTLADDYRGIPLYSTTDGSPVYCPLGKSPSDIGATELPRPSEYYDWGGAAWVLNAETQLALAKSAKAAEIYAAYGAVQQSPVTFNGHGYATDEATMGNLQKTLAGLALPAATPEGFAWIDASGTPRGMSYADLQGLIHAVWLNGYEAYIKFEGKMSAIQAESDVAAVEALAWD